MYLRVATNRGVIEITSLGRTIEIHCVYPSFPLSNYCPALQVPQQIAAIHEEKLFLDTTTP